MHSTDHATEVGNDIGECFDRLDGMQVERRNAANGDLGENAK